MYSPTCPGVSEYGPTALILGSNTVEHSVTATAQPSLRQSVGWVPPGRNSSPGSGGLLGFSTPNGYRADRTRNCAEPSPLPSDWPVTRVSP